MGAGLLGVAIGFASGVLSGAFGIGGGIVTTPAIRLVIGAPALVAVGTPLVAIVPGALTGAIAYRRQGRSDLRSGVVLGLSGAATAVLGALLTSKTGGEVVMLVTAALILYAAADTIVHVIRAPKGGADDGAPETPLAEQPRPRMAALAGIGALTGLYSGFLGLGGGFVLIPMLTRWLRFSIKDAIGTSLIVVTMLAVPGTIAHAMLGHVDWLIAAALVIGVVPGAILGARLTLGARDRGVRIGFAVVLIIGGGWLAASEIVGMLS